MESTEGNIQDIITCDFLTVSLYLIFPKLGTPEWVPVGYQEATLDSKAEALVTRHQLLKICWVT